MKKIIWVLMLTSVLTLPLSAQDKIEKDVKYHLVRMDDMGMSHSVNKAIEKVLDSGLPSSVSVMFACPWYREAVEILKEYPETAVGIHLTLNSEWENYRWGPVTGIEAVPSLVDKDGYFFPSRSALFANNPVTAQIEKELRAQIERAVNSGIKIDYMDFHMGAAVQTEELRALVENLAKEYNLGLSTYYEEEYSNITYAAPLESKTDSLVYVVNNLAPGVHLQVAHVGINNDELAAMKDMNKFGLKEMSKHREAEMNALLSPEFRGALKRNGIVSITYRDLIEGSKK